ncbi:MAG: hypothetical protein AB7K24_33870 [Gemmataceae bacterium]
MLAKMSLMILVTCVLATLVMEWGWMLWLPTAAAFAMLAFMKRVLG